MNRIKRVFTALLSGLAAVTLIPGGVPSVKADGVKKVACVGDSITQGLGNTPYPSRLQDLLGEGYEVKNFGLWGTTGCENTGRPYVSCDDSCYQSSLDYQPDTVLLMLGTNDGNEGSIAHAEEHYKEDMTKLIRSYQNLPSKPAIYLMTSPYAYIPGNAPVNSRIVVMQKELAKELDLPLVDIHAMTEDKETLFQDGLHPNDNGYYYLAMCIYQDVFGGQLAEVTVKTRDKADFRLGAWRDKTDENGQFVLLCPYGKQTFLMQKAGCEPVYTAVNITGDCTVTCEPLQVSNVAVEGIPFTNGDGEVAAAMDGDLFSSWQSGAVNDWQVGVTLERSRTVSSVDLLWETATKAKAEDGSMTVTYTANGTDWVEVKNPVFTYGEDREGLTLDTVTFDTVAVKGIRVTVHASENSKYAPKVYELSAYGEGETAAKVTVSNGTGKKEPDNTTRKPLPGIITVVVVIAGAVVLAGLLLFGIVTLLKKR